MKTSILKISCILILIFTINSGSDFQDGTEVKSSATSSTIFFSGYEWNVKSSAGQLWGPGPNFFNDSTQNVWVDANGSLHLKITYGVCSDQWYCAEIYSVESFGYGTYNFTLESGFENLDKNIVLGLFTYLDDVNEIDIEFAKWGQDTEKNGQFVLQPSWKANHIKRYEFNPQSEDSVHGFSWCQNTLDFWSYTQSRLSDFNWRYYGPGIPTPSTEHVHLNLWLMQGLSPSDYSEHEVVINSFDFTPIGCERLTIGFWWVFSFTLVGTLGIITTIVFLVVKRKRKMK